MMCDAHRVIKLNLLQDSWDDWQRLDRDAKIGLFKECICLYKDPNDIHVGLKDERIKYFYDTLHEPHGLPLRGDHVPDEIIECSLNSWDDLIKFFDDLSCRHKRSRRNYFASAIIDNKKFHRFLCVKLAPNQEIFDPYKIKWDKEHSILYAANDLKLKTFCIRRQIYKPYYPADDFGLDTRYNWQPCCLVLKAATAPTWRFANNQDRTKCSILEALMYAESYVGYEYEEVPIREAISQVKNCKNLHDVKKLQQDQQDCIQKSIEIFMDNQFDEDHEDVKNLAPLSCNGINPNKSSFCGLKIKTRRFFKSLFFK